MTHIKDVSFTLNSSLDLDALKIDNLPMRKLVQMVIDERPLLQGDHDYNHFNIRHSNPWY